jgi:sugar/nucleoside kinase (ribokinase family)
MERKGIASGGNLIVDYVKIVDSYPKQGNLSSIFETSRSTGGAVPNVLIDLAKMDGSIPLKAIGLVGDDENGGYVVDQLEKNHIAVDQIKVHPSLGTSFTDVMSVAATGERTFFHYRGANADLSYGDFDFSIIKADILHLGYALLLDSMDSFDGEYGTVMAKTLALAQSSGLKTSMDVVSENSDRFSKIVPPGLRYTDYCIINEVEASMITGIEARGENERIDKNNLCKICEKLFEMGVGYWTVIHSPEMGCGMDKSGNFYIQPSIKVPAEYIKGKVGAGDAFCAGILYSAYYGKNLDEAINTALIAAICNLSEANATDGMKPIKEAMSLFENYPRMGV